MGRGRRRQHVSEQHWQGETTTVAGLATYNRARLTLAIALVVDPYMAMMPPLRSSFT